MSRIALPYFLVLILFGQAQAALTPVRGPEQFTSDDQFLEYIQRQHFNYFREEVNPANGLVRDRSTADSPCSIAAVGFALSAYNVAAERGWMTRDQAVDRTLLTLETFARLPQGAQPTGVAGYRGWFYHFLDLNTGSRVWNCELSTMDTALLMMGVVDASLFFDSKGDPRENRIRELARQLIGGIDWSFMLRTNDFQLSMEWSPEKGHSGGGWLGYNEASCLYLLGLGMPGNPLPRESWNAWTGGYVWTNYGPYSFAVCPPLFAHQYSHAWLDFRGLSDPAMRERGSDYFENSKIATLVQRLYAMNNPLGYPNYSSNEWGFTACDGPGRSIGGVQYQAYGARGAPGGMDDGTIAPTAAVSSMPFAPDVCLAATRHLYQKYSSRLWTDKGFRDAYNAQADWWAPDAIGIDQGSIVLMIENARSGSIWKRMMKSPILLHGLERAGFSPPPPSGVRVAPSGKGYDISWLPLQSYQTGFELQTSSTGADWKVSRVVGPRETSVRLKAKPGIQVFVRLFSLGKAGRSRPSPVIRLGDVKLSETQPLAGGTTAVGR